MWVRWYEWNCKIKQLEPKQMMTMKKKMNVKILLKEDECEDFVKSSMGEWIA